MIVRPSAFVVTRSGSVSYNAKLDACRYCGKPSQWSVWAIKKDGRDQQFGACDEHLERACEEAATLEAQ